MIKILVDGNEATLSGFTWYSKDKRLRALLNSMIDPLDIEAADPHKERTIVHKALKDVGGKIVDEIPPERVEGRIY